jgi:hypothetical protein
MPLVITGKAPMANESESEDRPEKFKRGRMRGIHSAKMPVTFPRTSLAIGSWKLPAVADGVAGTLGKAIDSPGNAAEPLKEKLSGKA